jgi:hypothetical protein
LRTFAKAIDADRGLHERSRALRSLGARTCGVEGDDTSYGVSVMTATLSEPVGWNDEYFWLKLPVKSVWVYNKKTGKIYQKIDDIAPG